MSNFIYAHYDNAIRLAGVDIHGRALDIHDADVHHIPVNELFHRHTTTVTTLAVAIVAEDRSIQVVDGSSFSDGDAIEISNGVVEATFPVIIGGGGTNTFVLDRPIDNDFSVGTIITVVETEMAVNGSVTPVSFKLDPEVPEIWHVYRFLLSMIHLTAADDSKFGDLPALTNGVLLRAYNATAGKYRLFTNWKTNADIKMDMFDVTYTDKAGGGKFGTNGRGSVKIATGAAPEIDGNKGDYIEILIQDDLSSLTSFGFKGQGHIKLTADTI